MYNGKTLQLDEHLAQFETELEYIKGEDTITLESGHFLYFRKGDQLSQGDVGFLINRVLAVNVREIKSRKKAPTNFSHQNKPGFKVAMVP